MSFDHKELDELDQIDWFGIIWRVFLVIIGFGFAGLVLWYGVKVNSLIWKLLGGLVILFLIFMIWPNKKKK